MDMTEKVSVIVSSTPTLSWLRGAKKTRVPTATAPEYLASAVTPAVVVEIVEKTAALSGASDPASDVTMLPKVDTVVISSATVVSVPAMRTSAASIIPEQTRELLDPLRINVIESSTWPNCSIDCWPAIWNFVGFCAFPALVIRANTIRRQPLCTREAKQRVGMLFVFRRRDLLNAMFCHKNKEHVQVAMIKAVIVLVPMHSAAVRVN